VAARSPGSTLRAASRSGRAQPVRHRGRPATGRGGEEPTVTDANVFLGYIPEGPLADGAIRGVAGARRAGARACPAAPLALLGDRGRRRHPCNRERAHDARALRSVSSEKGRDPREFALLAYGGAGPVHAVGPSRRSSAARTVLVAGASRGSSARSGFSTRGPEFHAVRTCHLDATHGRSGDDRRGLRRARNEPRRPSSSSAPQSFATAGRTWEIEIEVGDPVDLRAAIAAFEDEHERLYGIRGEEGSPIEIRAPCGSRHSAGFERRRPALAVGEGLRPSRHDA